MLTQNKTLIDVFGQMADFFHPPEDALIIDSKERFWITEEDGKFQVTAVVVRVDSGNSSMTIKKDRIDENTLRVRIESTENMPPKYRRVATDERIWLDAIIAHKKHHNLEVQEAPKLPEWSIGQP